jgi:serine phosphatase RsbU (regulator of sigma subunit)
MTTATKSKLLWVADRTPPANVRQAAGGQGELAACDPFAPLQRMLCEGGVAIAHVSGALADPVCLAEVLADLERSPAVAIFMVPPEADAAAAMLSARRGQFICVPDDAPAQELEAKLAAAAALQPAISELQAELHAPRTVNPRSGEAEALDEELRLASRLQRDFLPRRLPEVGPVRFGVLYRPAGWVSGDIYDVARLDETHVGFYVADAVGHGLPAALLTMFIKRAFQTKRIMGNTYQIVPPEAALGELNTDICDQQLSGSPFCTAAYCIIDTAGLVLTFARAGHPEPVLIRPDGTCQALASQGALLGVFPEGTFQSQRLQLAPGDRLVLYSDGVEGVLGRQRKREQGPAEAFAAWAGRPRQEILLELHERLDSAPGDLQDHDDVTVLIMDIER